MIKEILTKHFEGHLQTAKQAASGDFLQVMEEVTRILIKAFKSGHKILLCGNGGSAADAQHISAEFVGRFYRERKSLPAIALTTDTSILTAIGNDYSYEKIFSRQVEGLGCKGDVLIALSTSGNSKNVLEAVSQASSIGMTTIGFTGKSGGILAGMTDVCFRAPSTMTPHIQEIHITALHAISQAVEDVLFGEI